MKIQNFPNSAEAALYAGYALNKLLEDQQGRPVLLLLSGGSALEILDGVNPENIGEKTTIAMLDERFSADPAVNNFSQLQKTDFYKEALSKECNFFGSLPRPAPSGAGPRPGETREQLAERLETNLKRWKAENPPGKIFATIGLGPDGHIAGIMPFPEDEKKFADLFMGERWAVAYNAGDKNQHPERITATIPLLQMVDAGIAYITGKEKQTIFERVQKKSNKPFELPGMLLHDIKNLQVFTDL